MRKEHAIRLTDEERATLTALVRTGTGRAYRMRRAQMLLLAERGQTDAQIAAQVEVHPRTVSRLRHRAATTGALAAVEHQPRPGAQPKLDGVAEAILVATACTDPPVGHGHWSTYLLAERLMAMAVVDSVSPRTVARTLKKRSSSRG
jgi:transposase